VKFGLLFQGAELFHSGYLTQFLSECNKIWQCFGSGQLTLSKFGELLPSSLGENFDSRYLAHYLSEGNEIWQHWGSGQSKLIP